MITKEILLIYKKKEIWAFVKMYIMKKYYY
jgi:hypothetical protein